MMRSTKEFVDDFMEWLNRGGESAEEKKKEPTKLVKLVKYQLKSIYPNREIMERLEGKHSEENSDEPVEGSKEWADEEMEKFIAFMDDPIADYAMNWPGN